MTLWTLDTCGFDATNENCQILINDNTGEETFIRKCPAHAAVSNSNVNQVHEENTRGSSNTLDHILRNGPAAMFDTLPDGSRSFKSGVSISWSWSGTVPNRILTVNILGTNLTINQKNNLQTAADNRFGANKIILTWS